LFPNDARTSWTGSKEKAVAVFLRDSFIDLDWVFNKQTTFGENTQALFNRRPDARVLLDKVCLVVETDEHAHALYNCECEHRRLREIRLDMCRVRQEEVPMVVLRFNPDSYTSWDGNVPSCWAYKKPTFEPYVKQTKDWAHRLNVLKEHIERVLRGELLPSDVTEPLVVELFY
jgi:hypothetical protein